MPPMQVGSWLRRFALLVPLVLAERGFCACDPGLPRAVVLYPEEDTQDGLRNVERLQASVSSLRGRQQRCIDIKHVPIQFDDPDLGGSIARLRVHPTAIIAGSGAIASATRAVLPRVPIVFAVHVDPVRAGLVERLDRPGGTATGVTFRRAIELKQLQLLHQAYPMVRRVGLVVEPETLDTIEFTKMRSIARAQYGVALEVLSVRHEAELVSTLALAKRRGVQAWIVRGFSPASHSPASTAAAFNATRLPVIYDSVRPLAHGGLMSYEVFLYDVFGAWARMLSLIADGVSPAVIPVEGPSRFTLTINTATAEVLPLRLAPEVLFLADKLVAFKP